MTHRPSVALLAIVAAIAVGPPPAAAAAFDFKTPGEAAYCRTEFPQNRFDAFRCITPNDCFWLRFDGLGTGKHVRITTGYDARYEGHREPVQVIGFGRTWATSDAEVIVCWSRRTGLTCRHQLSGWSFWLGRYRSYRIYRAKAGFPIRVRPLFRTAYAWCGINLDTLEPDNPHLLCWHPGSGVVAGIAYQDAGSGGGSSHSEQAEGYRPRGFTLLRAGAQLTWRCRIVTSMLAGGGCSTHRGRPVFGCEVSARVRCANVRGRGFDVDARGRVRTF
jgi:hypothetical protein